jgi:hypothetical protein
MGEPNTCLVCLMLCIGVMVDHGCQHTARTAACWVGPCGWEGELFAGLSDDLQPSPQIQPVAAGDHTRIAWLGSAVCLCHGPDMRSCLGRWFCGTAPAALQYTSRAIVESNSHQRCNSPPADQLRTVSACWPYVELWVLHRGNFEAAGILHAMKGKANGNFVTWRVNTPLL